MISKKSHDPVFSPDHVISFISLFFYFLSSLYNLDLMHGNVFLCIHAECL